MRRNTRRWLTVGSAANNTAAAIWIGDGMKGGPPGTKARRYHNAAGESTGESRHFLA